MKFRFLFLLSSLFMVVTASCNTLDSEITGQNQKLQFEYVVPTRGNSWVVNDLDKNKQLIGDKGITNWTDSSTKIRTYFKVQHTGNLNVGLVTKSAGGTATIKVSCGNESKEVTIKNTTLDTVSVGVFHIVAPGYQWV
ncbi:MAG TPA: DUF5077 domain-containing protein, partial [Draconibacterium sp.]|nr:DUF5077 domain-containing protein [Draconibacterium sp.]